MLRSAEHLSLCQECRVIPEDEHCVFNTLQMAGRLHMKEREKEAQPRVTKGNGGRICTTTNIRNWSIARSEPVAQATRINC
jgi:hypothetical protein